MLKDRAAILRRDDPDLAVLRPEEVLILEALQSRRMTARGLQDTCFGLKYAQSTGAAGPDGAYNRLRGARYAGGTSLTRNMLRRLLRTELVVRANRTRPAVYKLGPTARRRIARYLAGVKQVA